MIRYVTNRESIASAIEQAEKGDIIKIGEGIYSEKIKITKSGITLQGEGNVIIQNKDWSPKTHRDNKEYNTFRTYTVMVTGANVTIENITIKNLSVPSSKYGQAVALHVLGDNFSLINSKLISAQDTLFCGPLPPNLQQKYVGFLEDDELTPVYSRQYYKGCYIEGDVDFIFGGGCAIFDECHFHSIAEKYGFYFAPSHNMDQPFGFTVINSKFSAITKKSMFLARPWRDYGKVSIINSIIEDDILVPDGFNKWNNTNRDKTARFEFYNITANTSDFVPWAKALTRDEAARYNKSNIFEK